jgi:hypothetical protein
MHFDMNKHWDDGLPPPSLCALDVLCIIRHYYLCVLTPAEVAEDFASEAPLSYLQERYLTNKGPKTLFVIILSSHEVQVDIEDLCRRTSEDPELVTMRYLYGDEALDDLLGPPEHDPPSPQGDVCLQTEVTAVEDRCLTQQDAEEDQGTHPERDGQPSGTVVTTPGSCVSPVSNGTGVRDPKVYCLFSDAKKAAAERCKATDISPGPNNKVIGSWYTECLLRGNGIPIPGLNPEDLHLPFVANCDPG